MLIKYPLFICWCFTFCRVFHPYLITGLSSSLLLLVNQEGTNMTVSRLMAWHYACLTTNTDSTHLQLMIKARCLQPTRWYALNSTALCVHFQGVGRANLA